MIAQLREQILALTREQATELFVGLVESDDDDRLPIRSARIWNGRLRLSHRHPDDPKRLRAPDGTVYSFRNVAEFAARHDLPRDRIYALLSGRARTALGWSNPDIGAARAGLFLRAPDGVVHAVEPTLAAFCRRHGLQSPNVIALRKGTIKKHKGWTLVRNAS